MAAGKAEAFNGHAETTGTHPLCLAWLATHVQTDKHGWLGNHPVLLTERNWPSAQPCGDLCWLSQRWQGRRHSQQPEQPTACKVAARIEPGASLWLSSELLVFLSFLSLFLTQ